MWRVAEPFLEQAQDDATLIAIRDMERAGIDIITDGEMRRESYSNRFATALEGIDIDTPGGGDEPRRQSTPWCRASIGKVRRRDAGRGARHAVPAPQHRQARQDHAARPVHHDAAGQERVLPGPGRARDGLRRRGQRRGARPAGRRRRRDPARRAVAAQRSGRRQALRRQGDQPRARRHHGADRGAPVLRLCVPGEATSRPRISSCPSLRIRSRSRSRSRPRSRRSISAC